MGSRGEREEEEEAKDRLTPCLLSASDGKTDEVKRTAIPSFHHLLCSILSPSEVMVRMNDSRMKEN